MTFNIVNEEAIKQGRATDAYFERTEETLDELDENPPVVAEITTSQFADGENYKVLGGIKDAAHLLEGLPIDVYALNEGEKFTHGPVMYIEGHYRDFARYETSLLGFLSHASGIATAALECRRAAPNTPILSFGARHVHPSLGAVVERNALIGGFDGFSNVEAGNMLGRKASGTMPHALMLSLGEENQERAFKAFNSAVGDDVKRIALCDTFNDEVAEVIKAIETLGDDLDGVRLDTTSSRRGDFRHIIKEVQWELESRGYPDVDIFVSGGLGPEELESLRDVVAGFGVGGYVSNADPLDFSLDIVEKDVKPTSKRGKLSGVKNVFRTEDGGHRVTLDNDGHEDLMYPLIQNGEITREFSIDKAAERATKEL